VPTFIDDFMKQFGGAAGSNLASSLGIDKAAASVIIP
jgi:hypothetical protein